MNIETIIEGLRFPEGPCLAPDGSLWFVELKGEGLGRLDLATGQWKSILTGGAPNGIAIDAQGRVWFCDAEKCAIRRHDPATEETVVVADTIDGQPLFKPNDLAFDAAGNLLFTCPGDSRTVPTGYVVCLSPEGQLTKIAENLYFPNGLVFVNGGRDLIVAETYKQRLWSGVWNPSTRKWSQPHLWADQVVGAPGPDGMALASDGRLYVAVYGSGQIKVFDKQGRQTSAIDLPGKNPTNCCFGPGLHPSLYVTEAEKGLLLKVVL